MKKLTFIGIPLSLLLGLVLSTVGLTTRAAAADFIVTSNDEAELRLMIDKAEVLYVLSGGSEASTITFAANVTGTITLTTGELVIKSHLTIIGPGANLLTISGNNASRVFYITPYPSSIPRNVTVTLEGLTIAGGNGVGATNTGNGGGIYNESTLIINNCTVTLNSALGFGNSSGGGIFNSGTLTITNSTVSNNSTGGLGAGIRNNGGTLMLTNSTVSGNSSNGDGGGGIYSSGGGTVAITNSTITLNTTIGSGGGIFNVNGSLSITNSTVTLNHANTSNSGGFGGGIFAFGTETLNNTIVAGNFRGTATNPNDIDGPTETANHNLIGDAATSGGITNGVNGNKVGNSGVGTLAINTVLNFTLANNGGPTKTHALVPGSPAIDAGSNALALDASGNALTTDQRGTGFPRINGGTVDIGAFEALVALPNLTIDDVSLNEGHAGTTAFNFTVSLSSPAPAGGVTFDIATQNNSATTANNDYVQRSLTSQTISAGSSTYMFEVTVNGDATVEPGETFFVNVTNVTGATTSDGQGQGTIINDDSAPLPQLTINNVTQNEGNSGFSLFTFTVSLSAPAGMGGVTFDIATQDNSATTANNDYVQRPLTSHTIPAGNSTYMFEVTVNGDTTVEPNETFYVNVTSVTGATVSDGQGLGTITNDDSTGFNFTGFFQPVDNSPTINVVTAGSAIPVKFSLGGYQGMAIFASGSPYSQVTVCGTSNPTDVIEETVTAGASSLSYDATTDQYKYTWKTDRAWKGTCRKLILRFSDGTTREARFQFK